LTFGGYNDNLQKFATYVSTKVSADIRELLPSEKEFERYKDIVSRSLAAFDVKQPYSHCSFYSTLAMEPEKFQYSNSEMRVATADATLEDLISYVDTIWSSGKGFALVQGNMDETEANSLVRKVDKALGFKTISADEYPPELKPLPLPSTAAKTTPTRLVISGPNPSDANAAVQVVLQNLSEEPKDHVLMELVSTIIAEPFYEDLRTRQQLGYIVSSGIRALGKTPFMGFIVQSSVAPTAKLSTEILKYLDKVRPNLLEKLPADDLAVYINSLVDRKTEPDKQLAGEVTRNWAEISSGRLQFDRVQKEAAALLALTKDDVIDFWDRLYVNDGRRVLITEIVPRIGAASSATPQKSSGHAEVQVPSNGGLVLGIDDLDQFRKRAA
jgi:insulysin